jgi:acyl-CoA synthetase (AMP-forming)/AMP-acid ligase II
MSFNLATILRESALAAPDRPLLRFGPMEFTYRDVDIASGRVAAGLRAAGLTRGDTVAVQLPNLPEFVFAYFGALKAGITLMPLNPLLRAPEVAYHLQDSGGADPRHRRGLRRGGGTRGGRGGQRAGLRRRRTCRRGVVLRRPLCR